MYLLAAENVTMQVHNPSLGKAGIVETYKV